MDRRIVDHIHYCTDSIRWHLSLPEERCKMWSKSLDVAAFHINALIQALTSE